MPQGHTVRREPSLGLYQAHTPRARGLLSWAPNGVFPILLFSSISLH